jgi:hypothetical protein
MREGDLLEALLLALEYAPAAGAASGDKVADYRADPASLAALADWHDENNQPASAECLRWALLEGRRPGFNPRQTTYGRYFWGRQEPHPILDDPPAQLPDPLWLALKNNDVPLPVGSFKSYPTARAAWLALLAAWPHVCSTRR